ncbi:hypothetical protein DXG01_014776, partial [Tephrocybe rancida]
TPISEAILPAASYSGVLSVSKRDLLSRLEISEHLANRTAPSLPFAYEKYLAHLNAAKKLEASISAGTWVGKKPTGTDMIELFTSRSMWFDSYRPNFSKVHEYPSMVTWLEDGASAPKNIDAWGVEKTKYTFKDLVEFLANSGHLSDDDTKGRSKELKDKKGKGKARKVSAESEETQGKVVEKKSKKKVRKT